MWKWDFGDGVIPMETCSGSGCDNIASPVHTYLEPGTYTVTLTASNQYGCTDTETKQNYIVVVPACEINADFVGTPTTGSSPLTVQFTDLSTGNPTMWKWDFGDGVIPMETCSGSGCDNIASPVHTYLEPGTYTVTLTASNQYGCTDTETKQNYIVVVPACAINADFVGTPVSGNAPLKVQFTDLSTGNPTMWKWDFGDGVMPMEICSGSGCDNVANPYHTYLDPGTYTVTLTASNQQGCSDTEVKKDYITVGKVPPTDFIPVSPGWNFISVPKKLAPGSDTASIFSHIDVKGHSVFQYDANLHAWDMLGLSSPIKPLDSLWIYSSKTDQIPLTFDTNPVQTPSKQLKKGWNGVGFTGLTPLEAKYTFQSVQSQWVNCAGFDAALQRYNPMIIKGSNDDTRLNPYNGYWLYMSADGTLTANPA
jgi:PKD repeat protein